MAQFIPMAMMGVPALLSGISGIMDIVSSARKLKGGRLRKYKKYNRMRHGGRVMGRLVRRKRKTYRGRGAVADALGMVPLLGGPLSALARVFGGRVGRRCNTKGVGLAPMRGRRPYVGGLLGPPGSLVVWHRKGSGLLSPAGGAIYRKGHYRNLMSGRRIRVKPSMVGRSIMSDNQKQAVNFLRPYRIPQRYLKY